MRRKPGPKRRFPDMVGVGFRIPVATLHALDRVRGVVYPADTQSDVLRRATSEWVAKVDVEWVEGQIRKNLAERDELYRMKEDIKERGLLVDDEMAKKIAARKKAIQTQLAQGLRPGDNRIWLRNQNIPEEDIAKLEELLRA